jgi:hypothetical protein
MRIGVVSDTHNHLRNVERIVALFNAAGVERVVHTGDITQAKTLEALARLEMPVVGVYGNNDLERDALEEAASALSIGLVDPPLRLEWAGRSLAVVHDPLHIDASLLSECEFVLHGHNHLFVHEKRDDCWLFNPGECAGMMTGLNAIGVLDLETEAAERIRF